MNADYPREVRDLIRRFGGEGWVDRDGLWKWLASRGVTEAEKLARDNWTDGEYHHRWIHASGATFELRANWYDASSFAPLILWAHLLCV